MSVISNLIAQGEATNHANNMYLSPDKLIPNANNPYKINEEELKVLKSSIEELGILDPIIVRPIPNSGKYEVISGHRRLRAAKELGIESVPVRVKDVSIDEANIMLVDSNLHRECILPSEKAFAYKLKMEALSHQGKRTDLTSGQPVPKSDENRTAAIIGKDYGDSYKTVQRFIALANLIPELLDMVDEKKIAFTNGVELSYLPEDKQYVLLSEIEENDCVPSYSQAVRLKKLSQANNLPDEMITEIMLEPKANQIEKIKIPAERIRKYFPNDYSDKQIEDIIVKLCEDFQRKQMRKRNSQEWER